MRVRFRLKWIFIVFAAFGILFGIFRFLIGAAQERHAREQEIVELLPSFNKVAVFEIVPIWAKFVPHLSHSRIFERVVDLDLASVNAPDIDFAAISELSELRTLCLDNIQLDDKKLSDCSKLTQLLELRIATTGLSDRAAAVISKLPYLRHLDVSDNEISDSFLSQLHLNAIETLHLDGTSITDHGLHALDGCPNLTYISVANTTVSADGLDALCSRCRKLESVGILHTDIPAEAISELQARFPRIAFER